MKVVLDAVPFCFGPAGKVATVAARLARQADVTIFASGTALALAAEQRHPRISVQTLDGRSGAKAFRSALEQADVAISVMHPEAVPALVASGVPFACLDSLFWMWHDVPPGASEATKYFIQNFANVRERLEAWRASVPRAEVIGPIVEPARGGIHKEDRILIHFGGMNSGLTQVGVNTNYPFIVLGPALAALETAGAEVVVCGEPSVLRALRVRFSAKHPKVAFRFFGHDQFLDVLEGSRLLVTSPGLTATFEAFARGVPTLFLPPQNMSQVLNLRALRAAGAAPFSYSWEDLRGPLLTGREAEEEGVRRVLGAIASAEDNADDAQGIAAALREGQKADEKKVVEAQGAYFASLGANGVDAVERWVLEIGCRSSGV